MAGDTLDFRDVQHSDDLVRNHRNPDGRLYAYRDDGEHVVVSRGNEPRDRWMRRVPAERTRVLPGEQLWTIPDNWTKHAVCKLHDSALGLYRIDDTDQWVEVSIPTNNHLVDCWYGIKRVGDLALEIDDDLGTADEAREVADTLNGHEGAESLRRAIERTADEWDTVEEAYRRDVDFFRDERLWADLFYKNSNEHARFSDDWTFEEGHLVIAQPELAVAEAVDLPAGVDVDDVLRELRESGVLPHYVTLRLEVEEADLDMEYCTRALEEAGCTPPEVLDYYHVEIEGRTQTERAEMRGVDQSTVSGNVRSAGRKLRA